MIVSSTYASSFDVPFFAKTRTYTCALLVPAKYAILVKYAEGVCRAVGIKYGMGHCELKATFDEKRKKWVE